MSAWLSLPILTIAALLQATFIPQIRLLGGAPDLVFLLVLSWSLNANLETAVTWAFVGGIVQDLLSASPTGTSVIGLLLLVFVIKQLGNQIYGVGLVSLIAVVLFGTFVHQMIILVILRLTGFHMGLGETLSYTILPTIAYNVVALGPVYWFARRIQKRFTRDERAIS
jgi:rod shape-determining protein MreD